MLNESIDRTIITVPSPKHAEMIADGLRNAAARGQIERAFEVKEGDSAFNYHIVWKAGPKHVDFAVYITMLQFARGYHEALKAHVPAY